MTLNSIRLSVALVTRNRPESLDLCLTSLRSQSVQPFEVVVSDDSDPARSHETKAIAERWDCQYIPGPRRGLYANRNQVALACKGTHIRTMDDDHRLPEEHLAKCLEAVCCDSQAIWTTGEIGFIDGTYYATAKTANQLHPAGVGGPVQDINNNWAIADGSTIYPCTVFEQGHRMIEEYAYGSSYLEFGAYLFHKGFRSRCIVDAHVEHYATRETLTRANNLVYARSVIHSMLCFNLYFRPNVILALRYLFSHMRNVEKGSELLQSLPTLQAQIHQRWGKSA